MILVNLSLVDLAQENLVNIQGSYGILNQYFWMSAIPKAYLDPASNPKSKPQRLCATNCKSSTADKLQIFRTIFGISCKYLTKNCLHEITLFVLF